MTEERYERWLNMLEAITNWLNWRNAVYAGWNGCRALAIVTSASHVTAASDREASEKAHEMGEIGGKSDPLVPQG